MKCKKLSFLFALFFWPVFALTAEQNQTQLSLIPEILNEFDNSLNRLEENTNNSNQIIRGLQMKVNSMQTTIDTQQQQLQAASESLIKSERTAQEKFKNSEDTLLSLETSLTALSLENREKDNQILKLTQTNAKQALWLFILGGVIVLAVAVLIIGFMIKIKTGGIFSFFGK